MEQYWVKANGDAEPRGPYSAGDVRRLARSGEVQPEMLITSDGTTWRSASRVKGLFPAASEPQDVTGGVAGTAHVPNTAGEAVADHRPQDSAAPTAADSSPTAMPSGDEQEPAPPGRARTPVARRLVPPGYPQPIGARQAQGGGRSAAEASGSTPPPVAPALGYFVPGDVAVDPAQLRRRSPIPFTLVAALMFVISVVIAFQAYLRQAEAAEMTQADVIFFVAATALFLLLIAPALVLWLVWVHGIHKDVQALSGGQYTISPGQALGFSFIPIFDAFWIVYMPARVAGELNRHLEGRALRPISTGLVIACQIGSVLVALIMPGLMPVLYAVSMWQVQGGMNRLITDAGG